MQVGLACRLKPQRLSNLGELVHVSLHADTLPTPHLFNTGLNRHVHHISSCEDDEKSLETVDTGTPELAA